MDQREIALAAAKALDDKRGKDIVVLKVDEMTVITDYMVIAAAAPFRRSRRLPSRLRKNWRSTMCLPAAARDSARDVGACWITAM